MTVGNGRAYKTKPTPLPILIELRSHRVKQNLSLETLSDMTGYNLNSLQRWENGRVSPSLKSFIDYASALGFDVILKRKEE